MTSVTFDTLAFTQKLEAHGFTNEQAVAMVELQKETMATAIDATLATKGDINSLIVAIKDSRAEFKEALQETKAELKADNARLDKRLTLVQWVVFTTFALVALPHIRAALGL